MDRKTIEVRMRFGVETQPKLELGVMVHKPAIYIYEFILALGPFNFWLQVIRG